MKTETTRGEKEKAISGQEEAISVPKFSQFLGRVRPGDMHVVEALVEKRPTESYDRIAQRLGISRRHLFNLRQREDIRNAVYKIAKELFKAEIPDVLKALATKAKSGDNAAMKLFLDVARENSSDLIGMDPEEALHRAADGLVPPGSGFSWGAEDTEDR